MQLVQYFTRKKSVYQRPRENHFFTLQESFLTPIVILGNEQRREKKIETSYIIYIPANPLRENVIRSAGSIFVRTNSKHVLLWHMSGDSETYTMVKYTHPSKNQNKKKTFFLELYSILFNNFDDFYSYHSNSELNSVQRSFVYYALLH